MLHILRWAHERDYTWRAVEGVAAEAILDAPLLHGAATVLLFLHSKAALAGGLMPD